ncbi:hypothetical protein IWX49DRAFT_250414 [Phyllosticta citricarpa]
MFPPVDVRGRGSLPTRLFHHLTSSARIASFSLTGRHQRTITLWPLVSVTAVTLHAMKSMVWPCASVPSWASSLPTFPSRNQGLFATTDRPALRSFSRFSLGNLCLLSSCWTVYSLNHHAGFLTKVKIEPLIINTGHLAVLLIAKRRRSAIGRPVNVLRSSIQSHLSCPAYWPA